jgi:hypothetical protein
LAKSTNYEALSLNPDKTNAIKYVTINSPQYPLNIVYNGKYIEEGVNTQFLGLKLILIETGKPYRLVDSKARQSMLCS